MALENTILTKSQLATFSYSNLRQSIFKEMNLTEDTTKTDKDLLEKYFSGK